MEITEIYNRVFAALKQGSSEAVMAEAYAIFGHPVAAVDASFIRLTRIYPPTEQNDEIWDQLLADHRVSLKSVQTFQQHDLIKLNQSNPNTPVYINWGWFHDRPRITEAIFVDGNVAGYIAVLCPENEYQPWMNDALNIVADALAIILKTERRLARNSNALVSSFARDLITGSIHTPEELKSGMETAGLDLPGRYTMMAITPNSIKNISFEFLQNQLGGAAVSMLQHTSGAVHYLMLYAQSDSTQSVQNLTGIISSLDCSCGISRTYTDLLKTPGHKEQALMALNTGRRLQPGASSFFFDDIAFDALLVGAGMRIEAANCIHPAIDQLRAQDCANSTSYLETLRCYIMEHHSITAVCEALHIHRNTLAYRLRRIEELASISLTDNRTAAHLLLSFHILALSDKLKSAEE